MAPPWLPCGQTYLTMIGFYLSGCDPSPKTTLGFGWNQKDEGDQRSRPLLLEAWPYTRASGRAFDLCFVCTRGCYARPPVSVALPKPIEVHEESVIPPPIPRKYRGWRTGDHLPFVPGEWPRYDYYEANQGAGKTYVTVNGYPLQFFHIQFPLTVIGWIGAI